MIIALDGPAGAGKSTVARAVARELGLVYLDTGAMYRALTLVALRRGVDPTDAKRCAEIARSVDLRFDPQGRVLIDGEAGEPAIRGSEVTRNVSSLSMHAGVRAAVVERQRVLARQWGGLVAEGRDTTTVVFPEAEHKFFLIATPRERARRRASELGHPEDVAQIQVDMELRDRLDSTRALSPLRQAPGAVVIDTDGLEASDVVARVVEHVRGAEARA